MNVLVVEDEWLTASDFTSVLREAKHAIVGPTPSASRALELLDTNRVDFALVDFELRGSSGSPVIESLEAAHIPYLIVTGHPAEDLPERLRGSVENKPIDAATLLRRIDELVAETDEPAEAH